MLRLDVKYDVLPRESEILHLKFWATAFELLEGTEGHLLRRAGEEQRLLGDARFRLSRHNGDEPEESGAEDSKVIVRSNGTVTYVGKDIAYQLWKFGLLGKDFYYRLWSIYPDGHHLWATTASPSAGYRWLRGRPLRPCHAKSST